MKYEEAKMGRVFVIRLEDGEIVHEIIETFAREHQIRAAALVILGNAHEAAGTGTLFPDEEGAPILHMHLACGRGEETITGCIRTGAKVWRVMEVILFELLDTRAVRRQEPPTNFKFLQPES